MSDQIAAPAGNGNPMNSRERGAIVISFMVTLAFIGVTFMLFYRGIPDSSRDLANIMFGNLATMQAGVVAYWIGSSAGSAAKDRQKVEQPPSNP